MFSRSILAGIALAMAATDVMGFAPTATLSPSLARSGRAASLPAVVGRKSLVGPLPESPAESSRFLSEGVACCCLSILSTHLLCRVCCCQSVYTRAHADTVGVAVASHWPRAVSTCILIPDSKFYARSSSVLETPSG
jgi:hypothetical protein